jgi:hypothetical protein
MQIKQRARRRADKPGAPPDSDWRKKPHPGSFFRLGGGAKQKLRFLLCDLIA